MSAENINIGKVVRDLLSGLESREKNILDGRFGLAGGEGLLKQGERSREVSLDEVRAFSPEMVVLNWCGIGEKADTSLVRAGQSTGTFTLSVNVPGATGPLQVTSTQIEGFNWDYTPLGTGTAAYKTEADGYPIIGGTLIY